MANEKLHPAAGPLGDLQLQVMEVVWRRGDATVADIHRELLTERPIAYTTVLTTLQALERRGMVTHETVGKAYLYAPVVTRGDYADASVDKLVGDLFGGRPEELLCHLLGAPRVSKADLKAIKDLVRKGEGVAE